MLEPVEGCKPSSDQLVAYNRLDSMPEASSIDTIYRGVVDTRAWEILPPRIVNII